MNAVGPCENCGRVIGKLEQTYVWRKHVVCAECHVHLSAPAPVTAAARPAQAASALPPREHFHARAATPQRTGPAPAPVALQSDATAAHAPPMLLCTVCGHAYAFNDVVSDHGKVMCRTCALAAAAQMATVAARDKQKSILTRVAVAGVVVLALVGGTLVTLYMIKSRPDRSVATAAGSTPRARDAMAEAIMSAKVRSDVPELTTAPAEVAANAGETSALFAPDFDPPAPTTRVGAAASASLAPAPASQVIYTPPGAATPDHVNPVQSAPPLTVLVEPGPAVTKTTPPDTAAAANAATAPLRPPVPPPEGTAEWFVYKGRELFAQAKYPQALEQFTAAMKKHRNNADAWHGTGLCFQNMGDRGLALERLEKAVTLYNPPSRAAVFNCAAANLRENPMRAAKLVKDYLSRDGAERDEQLHMLMGKGLFNVGRQGRQNKVFAEAQEFYFAYNEQLESGRTDGRKRWGAEWVPGRDATEKWNRYRTRQQNAEALRTSVDRATKAKKDAWDKLYDQRTGMRLIGDKEKREGQQRYEQAAKQEIALRQQLKTAETEFNSAEKPPFPQLIKPVPMDEPRRVPPSAATR